MSELREILGEALNREPCPWCGELWECTPDCRSRFEDGIIRDGLDDGPPLPSERVIENACKKIDARQPRTDADRLNWLEAKKYVQIGINHRDGNWQAEIRIAGKRPKIFFGRSLRAAIDQGIQEERQ